MTNALTTPRVLLVLLATALLAPAAQGAGPFQFFPLSPCRVVDTRNTTPLQSMQVRALTLKGACGVPTTAEAVAVNVTITQATQGGWLTFFPTGVTRPVVSTINFTTQDQALANGAIVPLGAAATGEFSVYAGLDTPSATVHLIVDVNGYFQ